MKQLMWLVLFLVINFSALGIGSYLMNNGPTSGWYLTLNKAPWTPPGWVFGVAWTTIMICFSIYLSYLVDIKETNTFWILFIIQFILNVSWNYIFFNQHAIGFALVVIISLTVLVGYYLFSFLSDMTFKSLLIAPYFIWLLIATSLNAYSYLKN
ncbi:MULTISPECIES: TspO/MBR family protein [Flavobacteriaceae]|uniref:Tryptophan-rich sensory protein n=2 Tax=Flavobacteriaceae TaxID=49546 RepID=A0A4Y8AVG6_9FLAO|nr:MULTISPECIES: TspO/MBR family protein [Flavobacteriaceae]TEW75473.1 tryptophan-rich sensory protein [Gramella jeungdoensis]GGK45486.1 sensory protein [Lutibacter litoralis]